MLAVAFVTACFATSATGEEIDEEDCKEEDGCYIVYEEGKEDDDDRTEIGTYQLPQTKPASENIEVTFKPTASAAESGADLSQALKCKESLEKYAFDTFMHEKLKGKYKGGNCPGGSKCMKHADRRLSILQNAILGENCNGILPDAEDMVEAINNSITSPSP
jgi:hypothetical protein